MAQLSNTMRDLCVPWGLAELHDAEVARIAAKRAQLQHESGSCDIIAQRINPMQWRKSSLSWMPSGRGWTTAE